MVPCSGKLKKLYEVLENGSKTINHLGFLVRATHVKLEGNQSNDFREKKTSWLDGHQSKPIPCLQLIANQPS